MQIGVVNGWAVTFTDLTDRVRAEASVAAERVARAIIASANEAVVVCDAEGKITHANAAVLAIQEGDLFGQPFQDAIELKFGDAIGLVLSEDLVRMAIAGSAVQGIEAHAPNAPRAKDLLVSAAPLSGAQGTISGCVITMVDLSQRKAAERQQFLLMAELDHRVKNTLTLVLSIRGRTSESDIDTFRQTFSGRIHALAATHNPLQELVVEPVDRRRRRCRTRSLRANFERARGAKRVKLAIKPRAAIAVGLVFHELASNAAKYGSLSTGSGKIALTVEPFVPAKRRSSNGEKAGAARQRTETKRFR